MDNQIIIAQSNYSLIIDQSANEWHIDVQQDADIQLLVTSSITTIKVNICAGITARVHYAINNSEQVQHSIIMSADEKSSLQFKGHIQESKYVRLNLIFLPAESARIEGVLTSIVADQQRLYVNTEQNHQSSKSISSLLIKCVGFATGMIEFDGHIQIHQKTFGTQSSLQADFLRIDPTVRITAKPTLAIATKAVASCKHACTIKGIDKELFFYAQTRGMAYDQIQKLFITPFLNT